MTLNILCENIPNKKQAIVTYVNVYLKNTNFYKTYANINVIITSTIAILNNL